MNFLSFLLQRFPTLHSRKWTATKNARLPASYVCLREGTSLNLAKITQIDTRISQEVMYHYSSRVVVPYVFLVVYLSCFTQKQHPLLDDRG